MCPWTLFCVIIVLCAPHFRHSTLPASLPPLSLCCPLGAMLGHHTRDCFVPSKMFCSFHKHTCTQRNPGRALQQMHMHEHTCTPFLPTHFCPRPCSSFLPAQLLCSDGIWNSMQEKVVLRFVKQRLQRGRTPAEVCRELCKGQCPLLMLHPG